MWIKSLRDAGLFLPKIKKDYRNTEFPQCLYSKGGQNHRGDRNM